MLEGDDTRLDPHTGDGTSGLYIWGAQLEPGSTATNYQAVTTTYDCAEAGVPDCYFLQADGSDDGMVTPAIDFNAVTGDGQVARNRVKASENLTDASWANGPISLGSRTNGTLSVSNSEGWAYIAQSSVFAVGMTHTVSFDAVCDQTVTNVPLRVCDVLGGTASATQLVNMVAGVTQRLSFTLTTNATTIQIGVDARNIVVPGGSDATGYNVTINKVQVELGTTATEYQKKGTDKIGVFTGVRKLSDAAIGMVMELSPTVNSNNGTFWLAAPIDAGVANFNFSSKGTVWQSKTRSNYAAPLTAILGARADISADSIELSVNGSTASAATGDQGTGNYGNYALYYFRRGGASLPLNGLEYGNFIVSTLPDAAQIAAGEAYQNNYIGAY